MSSSSDAVSRAGRARAEDSPGGAYEVDRLDQASLYSCNYQRSVTCPLIGERPPKLFAHPNPVCPNPIPFIVCNPPREYGGFWSLRYEDNLRNDIHTILRGLDRVVSQSPDGKFLEEFLHKGYYLVHSVKCWTRGIYPGYGRDRNKSGWGSRRKQQGLSLLRICVDTHLRSELAGLAPSKICLLGEMAFEAFCLLVGSRAEKMRQMKPRPTDGTVFDPGHFGLEWPTLYSCLPVGQKIPYQGGKVFARDVVSKHLATLL